MSALETLTGRLTLPYRRGAEFVALALGASGSDTTVTAYEFAEYRARWGQDPTAPSYVLSPRVDVLADDLAVTIAYKFKGVSATTSLTIPQGTASGNGFAIPLPQSADGDLRLISIAATPSFGPAPGAASWDLVALLGTIAKLSWILAAEKNVLVRARSDVRRQRSVATAFGAGLDAIGKDLRIPRFPPRPYSYDGATIALWHLDDAVPTAVAIDETVNFGNPGHPGTVTAARAGTVGNYGTAFTFVASGSAIAVPPSTDFDIAANANITIEAFVKADAPSDVIPRAIVARRAAETAVGSNVAGWSLCVTNARGIAANVLFALCDGALEIRCFADVSIADGNFHHVAAIVDRSRERARLFVDGVQRASAAIDTLGAVAPPDGVRLGSTAAGNALAGSIDEVRLSRIARRTFHPVLGEDDEAYRARLRIFRRWVLPTPQRLLSMINEAAPFPLDPAPYVLVETNRLTQTAARVVRIVPAKLVDGMSIAVDGTVPAGEQVAGTPADDAGLDPTLDLIVYANAGVDATSDPGHARMQAVTGAALDALAARLAADAVPGRVVLEHSRDVVGPSALHAVGRALRLRHETLTTEVLGALAHRVGFTYVRNLGPNLAVAVLPGERIAIRSVPPATARVDVGSSFDLTVDPALPVEGTFGWTIISVGSARAHLSPHAADLVTLKTTVASRSRVRVTADAPGDIAVRVEHAYRGRTRSGTLTLRIDATMLVDGHALDAAGNTDSDLAAIVGTPKPGFDPGYLIAHAANPAIDFGADPNAAKMQVATRDALDELVALLAARATPGRLKVISSFVTASTGVAAVGRSLVLGHETLDPGLLGALAARFFSYVLRTGATVAAAVAPDSLIGIGDAAAATVVPPEIVLGTALHIGAVPAPISAGSFNWSTRMIGAGAGSFDTLLRADTHFTPTRNGQAVITLTHVTTSGDLAAPYTFELRLKPALDIPATIVPKPQYDIIMNVLDAYHPIGVEVRTERLRSHVVEIEHDPTKAFPAYSFPDFRT